jgi:hypothetical protein
VKLEEEKRASKSHLQKEKEKLLAEKAVVKEAIISVSLYARLHT